MPPQAYALVTLFMLCSVALCVAAVRLVGRADGPRTRPAYVLPIAAGFGALAQAAAARVSRRTA